MQALPPGAHMGPHSYSMPQHPSLNIMTLQHLGAANMQMPGGLGQPPVDGMDNLTGHLSQQQQQQNSMASIPTGQVTQNHQASRSITPYAVDHPQVTSHPPAAAVTQPSGQNELVRGNPEDDETRGTKRERDEEERD